MLMLHSCPFCYNERDISSLCDKHGNCLGADNSTQQGHIVNVKSIIYFKSEYLLDIFTGLYIVRNKTKH